jgi:regulator of sirC expression with transglutaminase-like and TPR domain
MNHDAAHNDDFSAFASLPDRELSLPRGALLIARDTYSHLDVDNELAHLGALVAPLTALRSAPIAPADKLAAVLAHIFGRERFRGNEEDYYDLRNSFLNDVLERRTGLPITLAILVLEAAATAGLEAHGVSFPGH